MREILFRGKRKDNGEWVYGSLLIQSGEWISKDEQAPTEYRILGCRGENYLAIPKTVGQYTGLQDKNGTKIFENGYMIIDNKTYKVIFDNAEYILTNIFNCDIITLKNNSIKGVFVDEI